MPFQIIRADITKMKCDAIVNPTNEGLLPGGGVDAAIHKAAGTELYVMCQTLGGLSVGGAKMTPAYNLPCKYVIHTVGPYWQGGGQNERQLLQSCYRQALSIAKASKCKSIAFPLISSGTYGYPKDQVLATALDVIKDFLYENEMLIYLVVYDKTAYELSEQLSYGVAAYIDDNYAAETLTACDMARERVDEVLYDEEEKLYSSIKGKSCRRSLMPESREMSEERLPRSHWRNQSVPEFGSVNSIKKFMYRGFKDTLLAYVDEKGISDTDCYKRANVSRQTWHKIITDPHYTPKKNTAIALAIALELNIDETQALLATAGFILSKSSLFDVIIMYCIVKGIYDVFQIDTILFRYDQTTLFSKE